MNETEMINYVQEAFHMESEKHQQLLEIATMKEVSKFRYLVGKYYILLVGNWIDLIRILLFLASKETFMFK